MSKKKIELSNAKLVAGVIVNVPDVSNCNKTFIKDGYDMRSDTALKLSSVVGHGSWKDITDLTLAELKIVIDFVDIGAPFDKLPADVTVNTLRGLIYFSQRIQDLDKYRRLLCSPNLSQLLQELL